MGPTGRAAVFHGPGKPFEIRELPLPEVEPDAVLIRVTVANICGSDLHFWRGDAPLRLPEDGWIYGHEMTGRVARFFFQAKDGIRDGHVTGVQTCALPICSRGWRIAAASAISRNPLQRKTHAAPPHSSE